MKNQIHSNVLAFNKSSLVELNNSTMRNIESGITPGVLVFYILTAMGAGVAVGNALDGD